ncbi:MAG TPA: hypothetical protein PKJ10_07280, partial [Smithella sp.]|jgi:hypothetical protein|nr:hypothetical protein [Smithella sp.]
VSATYYFYFYLSKNISLLGLRVFADVVRTSRDLQVIRCAGLAALKPRSLFEVQNHQSRHSEQAQRDPESKNKGTGSLPPDFSRAGFAGVTEK